MIFRTSEPAIQYFNHKPIKLVDFRYKEIKLFCVLFLGFVLHQGLTQVYAQQTIPAAGGNFSGTGGSVSFTVGQDVYTTTQGSDGSVAQGVQQPYEISVLTGLEEAIGIKLDLTAYPNPTTDFLILKVDASTMISIRSMSYQLSDISGKLLENEKLTGSETSIDMKNLVPAIYFLKISSNNKEIITFKIIKN
jgi:hypothetical protein